MRSKPRDITNIVSQAVELLKSAQNPALDIATGVTAHAIWDWAKSKFKRRSAATTEAVEAVSKSNATPTDWEALKLQLRKALEDDAPLRKELENLLPKNSGPPADVQNVHQSGVGHKSAQIKGNRNIVIQ